MPLDLAVIRARWAAATSGPWGWESGAGDWQRHRLWRPIGCMEVLTPGWDGEGNEAMTVRAADAAAIAAAPEDIADLLSEVEAQREEIARLRVEAESARAIAAERLDRLRTTAATLVEELGSQGPEDADQVATRAAAEIRRLRAEMDAARPVVEWRRIRDFERANPGYLQLTVSAAGWKIRAGDKDTQELATIDSGPETGDAGKAACYAAWLRACGLPPAPAKKIRRRLDGGKGPGYLLCTRADNIPARMEPQMVVAAAHGRTFSAPSAGGYVLESDKQVFVRKGSKFNDAQTALSWPGTGSFQEWIEKNIPAPMSADEADMAFAKRHVRY